MTLSMLRGENGRQASEVEKLVSWVAGEQRPDVVVLSNAMLAGIAPRLKEALGCPIVATLQGAGNGLYNLEAGSLSAATEVVGLDGLGQIVQTGGANNTALLLLGTGSGGGTYDMSGGNLTTGDTLIAAGGAGLFLHSGGNHTVTDLQVGNTGAGNAAYTLSDTGNLVAETTTIGVGSDGFFAQIGGSHSADNLEWPQTPISIIQLW